MESEIHYHDHLGLILHSILTLFHSLHTLTTYFSKLASSI